MITLFVTYGKEFSFEKIYSNDCKNQPKDDADDEDVEDIR